jgi:hypothetical protein
MAPVLEFTTTATTVPNSETTTKAPGFVISFEIHMGLKRMLHPGTNRLKQPKAAAQSFFF